MRGHGLFLGGLGIWVGSWGRQCSCLGVGCCYKVGKGWGEHVEFSILAVTVVVGLRRMNGVIDSL